jgi:hypothetical protein
MIAKLEGLMRRQLQCWPQLRIGVEGLEQAKTRRIRIDWFDIHVRHIPHRLRSTTAAVDRESIAARPCFICAANLPPEEEGIPFNDEFTIYCNPFPIVEGHFTVAHREHVPQGIANYIGTMLELAAALPGHFIIYNGPEAGASAPDHMHFQAGSRALLPIEQESAGLSGLVIPNYGRKVLLFRGRERSALDDRVSGAIEALREVTGKHPEPPINIAMLYERGEWTTYLFPRGKLRPEVFYRGEVIVSPATIDLCGILVAPRAEDFDNITGESISAIFSEVTLPDSQFQAVANKLEHAH